MPNLMSAIGGVDISEATATAADVKSGKTFYSGASDEMQTGNGGVFYLGTSRSIDVKSKFPDQYQNFTNSNFLVVTTGGWWWNDNTELNWGRGNDNINAGCTYNASSVSYNSSTGVLSVGGASVSAGWSNWGHDISSSAACSVAVYLVIGGITNKE